MENSDEQFLARWLNNDLTDEELIRFKKSEDYKLYEKIGNQSQFLEVPNLNTTKASWEKVSNKTVNNNNVRKLNYNWTIGVAASVLIFLGLVFGLKSNTDSFISGMGEHLTVILPDSSEVVLNGNSKLEFDPSEWKSNTRVLSLMGEAFFKVKKGSLFTVNTSVGNVQVLGTQFNVNTLANSLEVKCYSGKVKASQGNLESVLTKGKGYRVLNNEEENWSFNAQETSWLNNEHRFYKTPMSKVFAALENQFNLSIQNKDSHMNKRFTGSFSNKSKTVALKIVLEAMNIDFKQNNNTIVLLN